MALIHDLAEALVGDITPMDEVPKTEKKRLEEITMDYSTSSLLGNVNGGIAGKEINDIWHEFEDGETLESMFVNDVDNIELILQMVEYGHVHKHQLDLGGFSWVASRTVLPEVKEWANEVLREREKFGAKDRMQHTWLRHSLRRSLWRSCWSIMATRVKVFQKLKDVECYLGVLDRC